MLSINVNFKSHIAKNCKDGLIKISMEFPQKLKVDRPYDPAISFLGIYATECM
jgi:hypothetical protein